ncbi:hypothetical protein RALTA_A1647 [Cupriavidus taiwanensis LMG 19424]|uniref:Uncharacterized protein n=1 Tax=Cupriavidus taiwanensis (strain DSM 17343 / BCRC 17206 / CCUG 44338 / CIP 107171 / LMG 19424 / R1) TaxID=977880 RepID=B3R273_CUPTR|nr:hypothetical protein RALTA_A1647 [Cupriavidus taiwanensis LMG 19424]
MSSYGNRAGPHVGEFRAAAVAPWTIGRKALHDGLDACGDYRLEAVTALQAVPQFPVMTVKATVNAHVDHRNSL